MENVAVAKKKTELKNGECCCCKIKNRTEKWRMLLLQKNCISNGAAENRREKSTKSIFIKRRRVNG